MRFSGISRVVLIFGIAALLWALTVMLSGMDINLSGIEWDFERTGQLGDSFGVLSSLMTSIAAYFAFGTYRAATAEGRNIERRAAETSYLNLLERRFDVLDRVRMVERMFRRGEFDSKEHNGQAALDYVYENLIQNKKDGSYNLKQIYDASTRGVTGLSSFIRFTYHIVALVDRQFCEDVGQLTVDKQSTAYQHLRLLRAQMSDAEILTIAINCVVSNGYERFKPLVEKYALLHNVNPDDAKMFRLDHYFAATAFGVTKEDRIALGDAPSQDWLDSVNIDDEIL